MNYSGILKFCIVGIHISVTCKLYMDAHELFVTKTIWWNLNFLLFTKCEWFYTDVHNLLIHYDYLIENL